MTPPSATDPAAAPGQSRSSASAPPAASAAFPASIPAGIAWLATAVLTGYLALVQIGLAGELGQLGVGSGDLQATAIFNGIAAALTAYFGARLLMGAPRGFLLTSAVWAGLDVAWGAYQVANGATHWAYVGAIVAAGTAGILSLVARSQQQVRAQAPVDWPSAPPAPAPTTQGVEPAGARAAIDTPSASPGATPSAVATTSDRGKVVGVLVVLLIVAVGAALVLSGALPGRPGVASNDVPPVGDIWFGSSFDPSTLALHGRSDAMALGQPVALVAHLTRASTGETLALDLSIGGLPATWPAGQIAAGDDVIGIVLPAAEIFQPGALYVSVVDAGGNLLAHGEVTITP